MFSCKTLVELSTTNRHEFDYKPDDLIPCTNCRAKSAPQSAQINFGVYSIVTYVMLSLPATVLSP